MSAAPAGTFANGANASSSPNYFSAPVLIPRGVTQAKLFTSGCNASNTIKTQKRTVPGGTFADQVTYNSEQAGTVITVVEGEEWQIASVALQANTALSYKFSIEA